MAKRQVDDLSSWGGDGSSETNDRRYRELLIMPVALAILLGWGASLGVALFTERYTPLATVSPLMVLMAGYVFGASIVTRARGNGNGG